MPDDKNKKAPHDGRRISLDEDYEVRYWKNKFGVSEQELRDAVHRAGHSAMAVKRELNKKAV